MNIEKTEAFNAMPTMTDLRLSKSWNLRSLAYDYPNSLESLIKECSERAQKMIDERDKQIEGLHSELAATKKILKLVVDASQLLAEVIEGDGGKEKVDLAQINFDKAIDLIRNNQNNV